MRAMEKCGYQPNMAARALVTGKTRAVSLWMPHLGGRHGADVLYATEHETRERGYDLLIRSARPHHLDDAHQLARWNSDGILAYGLPDVTDEFWRIWSAREGLPPPIVSMGSYAVDHVDMVHIDLAYGTRAAVRHLVSVGCERVALLIPGPFNTPAEPRVTGYHEAAAESGLEPEVITSHFGRPSAGQAVLEFLRRDGRLEGLFCFNDELAIGACSALREAGYRLPEDIALVGCDGIEDTAYVTPPLSTLLMPIPEMARNAWTMLEARMANPDAPRQALVLRPELIVRESSRFQRPAEAGRRKGRREVEEGMRR
jgi:LacI family transcriptional regulator